MTTTKIKALGITQQWSTMRWKATGYVDGVGWLEAWGKTLIEAMKALQVLAAQRATQREEEDVEKSGSYDARSAAIK
jgi:hypothetical protein